MSSTQAPRAFLAGQPILGSSAARWTLRGGVDPVIESFDLMPDARSALAPFLGGVATVILNLEGQLFEKLYVVREEPASNPNIYRVMVADRRYLWRFRHIHRRYNLRRRMGFGRRRAWDEREPVIDPVVPELSWKRWTLAPDGHPWKPAELLRDVLHQADPGADLLLAGAIENLKTPIEDLEIDDPGPQAVARALSYLPGGQITVDPGGAVRFYFTPSGEEVSVQRLLTPEIVGGGHAIQVVDTLDRPSLIRVKFSYQVELRFDFVDDTAAEGAELRRRRGFADVTPRRLENVLPVPDHTLDVGTADAARTVAQGTWLSFEEVWEAWGRGGSPEAATLVGSIRDGVRFAFAVPEMGLWAALDVFGRYDDTGNRRTQVDVLVRDWTSRIHAIQAHYRQSFRLPRDWMDRIHELSDKLTATIDRVYGERAPAVAFGDHAIRPNQKGFFLADEREMFYVINVAGYPGIDAPITSELKPSPARVVVVDSDQGVVRLEYLLSPFGTQETVLPSRVTGPPNRKPDRHGAFPIAWNCTSDENGLVLPRLREDHGVAVILSAFPAMTELYEVIVRPEDALPLLPAVIRDRVGNTSRGPELDLRIGPGVEVARVRWVDSQDAYDAIESIFFPEKLEALRKIDPRYALATVSSLARPFVINDRPQAKIDREEAASLPAIAQAAAASVWARWAIRTVGAATGNYVPSLVPLGSTGELAHTVNPEGSVVTTAAFPPPSDPLSMFGLMDPSTRRILMRTLDGNL